MLFLCYDVSVSYFIFVFLFVIPVCFFNGCCVRSCMLFGGSETWPVRREERNSIIEG